MAKKFDTEEPEAAIAEAGLTPIEEAKEGTVTNTVRTVKIRTSSQIECIIAHVKYNLRKDKVYEVPVDVAAILCNSNKAYRI